MNGFFGGSCRFICALCACARYLYNALSAQRFSATTSVGVSSCGVLVCRILVAGIIGGLLMLLAIQIYWR
jgi:hypothetical protein